MYRKKYPDDLTDVEWDILHPWIEKNHSKRGRKSLYSKREFFNAIFYLLRTGCAWRHLPHDFHPWKTVYTQFRRWRQSHIFKKVHTLLRKKLRKQTGRKEDPSAAIVDSQSGKTTEKGGIKGYDGAKKVKGRKRHILVDSQGLMITAAVTEANLNDRDGLQRLLEILEDPHKRLKKNLG